MDIMENELKRSLAPYRPYLDVLTSMRRATLMINGNFFSTTLQRDIDSIAVTVAMKRSMDLTRVRGLLLKIEAYKSAIMMDVDTGKPMIFTVYVELPLRNIKSIGRMTPYVQSADVPDELKEGTNGCNVMKLVVTTTNTNIHQTEIEIPSFSTDEVTAKTKELLRLLHSNEGKVFTMFIEGGPKSYRNLAVFEMKYLQEQYGLVKRNAKSAIAPCEDNLEEVHAPGKSQEPPKVQIQDPVVEEDKAFVDQDDWVVI